MNLQKFAIFLFSIMVFACAALPMLASAHAFNYGVVETHLLAQGKQLQLNTAIPNSIHVNATSSEDQRTLMEDYFTENLTIANGNVPCTFTLNSFDNTSSSTRTTYDGVFTCSTPIVSFEALTIHSSLFSDFFQAFDHFVTVTIGTKARIMAFSPTNQDYPKDVSALDAGVPTNTHDAVSSSTPASNTLLQQPTPVLSHGSYAPTATFSDDFRSFAATFFSIFKQFIVLGMFHIWTGYDHMLFLLSVILLLRSVKKIVILVTSFTIAHSITLILAGLHVVTLSPKIVEPLIALTILYMAVRNLMLLKNKHNEHGLPERWATTFGFGLIHGLGFAGALADVGIPSAFFVPALLIFNIGIELGQLGVLLIIVPLLLYIDSKPYRRILLMVISGAVAALSCFWVAVRLMGGSG